MDGLLSLADLLDSKLEESFLIPSTSAENRRKKTAENISKRRSKCVTGDSTARGKTSKGHSNHQSAKHSKDRIKHRNAKILRGAVAEQLLIDLKEKFLPTQRKSNAKIKPSRITVSVHNLKKIYDGIVLFATVLTTHIGVNYCIDGLRYCHNRIAFTIVTRAPIL